MPSKSPNKGAPRQRRAQEPEEDLDAVLSEVGSGAPAESKEQSPQLTFLLVGLVAALVPVFMFHVLLNMPFSVGYNRPAYAVGVLFNAFILSIAYKNVMIARALTLANSKEMTDITLASVKREAQDVGLAASALVVKKKSALRAVHQLESLTYSLYFNNALFIATALFFGFVMFGQMSAPFSYILTSSFSAVVTSVVASKQLDSK